MEEALTGVARFTASVVRLERVRCLRAAVQGANWMGARAAMLESFFCGGGETDWPAVVCVLTDRWMVRLRERAPHKRHETGGKGRGSKRKLNLLCLRVRTLTFASVACRTSSQRDWTSKKSFFSVLFIRFQIFSNNRTELRNTRIIPLHFFSSLPTRLAFGSFICSQILSGRATRKGCVGSEWGRSEAENSRGFMAGSLQRWIERGRTGGSEFTWDTTRQEEALS